MGRAGPILTALATVGIGVSPHFADRRLASIISIICKSIISAKSIITRSRLIDYSTLSNESVRQNGKHLLSELSELLR